MTRSKGIDWDAVDFSESTHDIARRLGVSRKAVYYQRRKRGLVVACPQRRSKDVDYSDIDMSYPASTIARAKGVTIEAARAAKARLGFGRVPSFEDSEREFPG